jgi:2-oxo-3-hexenedioate decarboxylase
VAERLIAARANRTAIPQITAESPELSLVDAYRVQSMLLDSAVGAGDKLCGYKMGLTSQAKQKDVGVSEPIRGFLLKSTEITKGAPLKRDRYIHPRVEPEIAIILKHELSGTDITVREVVPAIECILPAIEIVDSRYQNFQFTLPDVVADNTSAAAFILGEVDLLPQLSDLNLLGVLVKKNGELLETGAPAAALGNPLLSVVWAARDVMQRDGRSLPAGSVILTGGLTTSVSVQRGEWIEIEWESERFHIPIE